MEIYLVKISKLKEFLVIAMFILIKNGICNKKDITLLCLNIPKIVSRVKHVLKYLPSFVLYILDYLIDHSIRVFKRNLILSPFHR